MCTILELFHLADFVKQNLSKISTPFFIQQGTEDQMVDVSGAQNLYDNSISWIKKIKKYEGGYHCLVHDYVAMEVIKDSLDWIDEVQNKN